MSEPNELSPEDRARVSKSALQLAAYINFMRWSANFKRDELKRHPTHGSKIFHFSPMQSGRFSFAIEGDTLLLGVQNFECAWMAPMPFECAYVTDRLYLQVDSILCMDAKMLPLTLGIFVDEQAKLGEMKKAKYLQLVRVEVRDGCVADVGRAIGLGISIKKDLIRTVDAEKQRIKQQDAGRFF